MSDYFQHIELLHLIDWRNPFYYVLDGYREKGLALLSFTALIQALLATGFAYHSIKKVRKLVDSYMAVQFRDYETIRKNTSQKVSTEIDEILNGGNVTLPNDIVKLSDYKEQLNDLLEDMSDKRQSILRCTGQAFFILGLYCFLLLILSGFENANTSDFYHCKFKNTLTFFNGQVLTYLVVQYFFDRFDGEKSLIHTSFVLGFLIVSVPVGLKIHYAFDMFAIVISTLFVLFTPFILACTSAFRLSRGGVMRRFDRQYQKIVDQFKSEFADVMA